MGNPEFRFCSFRQNLLAAVLAEQSIQATVFIFPTEISKKECLKLFQKNWSWSDARFLTMEEFKESCFRSSFPLLKEEKRTLAFYVALDRSMRQALKIQHYFQSIEAANNFFTFWEECNEELLTEPLDFDLLAGQGVETQEWQRKLYEQLWKIKQSYADLIHHRHFEDVLFTHRLENLDLQDYTDYHHFVWVNQFYYTRLEKELIDRLSATGKQCVIYSQTERHLVRVPQLESPGFSIKDFTEHNVRQITIHESKSDFAMMADLTECLQREPISVIVDNNPSFNAYYRFLSTQKITLSLNQSLQQSTLYRFFQRLYELIDSLQPDQQDPHRLLLPLQICYESVADTDFFKIFTANANMTPGAFQEQALDILARIITREYRYVDLPGDVFHIHDPLVRQAQLFLQPVLDLLQKALAVQTLDDLLQLIDAPIGIRIKDILSDQERLYSDILDVFYQGLADFSGIATIGLAHNWQEIFSPDHPSHPTAVSRGWFRLLLEYLKAKRIHFSTVEMPGLRVDVTNLLDTRNLQYQNVALINAQEGLLPQSPSTPFLFNEYQRKKLGLKCYEQIRLREKYYFSRLTLNSAQVHLFAQKNLDKNTEPSSFIEELALYCDAGRLQRITSAENRLRSVYRTLLSDTGVKSVHKRDISDAFFILPFRSVQDYPDKTIRLSFYEFQNLADSPFIYYLRHVLAIDPRPVQMVDDFSAPFIGVIAHEVLNNIWHLFLQDEEVMPGKITWLEICDRYIERARRHIVQEKRWQIPQNHSRVYFQEIYWPVLHSGIRSFFNWLENRLQIKIEKTRIYPEAEFSTSHEREGLTLFTLQGPADLWTVKIRGRADLRLEATDATKKQIFDYKTGNIDKRQLLFYELLYYLINDPSLEQDVFSYGYNLVNGRAEEMQQMFKKRSKAVPKRQVILEFTEQLRTLISDAFTYGYVFSGETKPKKEWQEIVRSDLRQKMILRNHNANVY